MPETEQDHGPFIDTSGEHPRAVSDRSVGGRCYGSSVTGGECEAMVLSFGDTDEWREHRSRFHPVRCKHGDCTILSAYKRDGSPSSYCFKHIPEDPDLVYRWHRTNTKSVVPPPLADEDHPIEAALQDIPASDLASKSGPGADDG